MGPGVIADLPECLLCRGRSAPQVCLGFWILSDMGQASGRAHGQEAPGTCSSAGIPLKTIGRPRLMLSNPPTTPEHSIRTKTGGKRKSPKAESHSAPKSAGLGPISWVVCSHTLHKRLRQMTCLGLFGLVHLVPRLSPVGAGYDLA